MGYTAAIEITTIYFQFLSITYSLYTSWSVDWRWYIDFVLFWKFEIPNVDIYGFSLSDIRVHYVVITAIIPYATTLFVQSIFQKKLKLLLIIFFQLFMSMFVAGIAMSASASYDTREAVKNLKGASSSLIATGIVAMAAYGLAGGVIQWRKSRGKAAAVPDMGETGGKAVDKKRDTDDATPHTLKQKKLKLFVGFVVTIVCFILDLAAIAYISLIFIVLYIGATLSPFGRQKLHEISIVVRRGSLKFLFFILGLLYIPITTAVFEMIVCKEVTCPKGQKLRKPRFFDNLHGESNKKSGRESLVSKISLEYINVQDICEVCDFGANSLSLCPGETESVLGVNHLISCKYDIASYYLPSAIFLLFIVCIGIPLLYYQIVKGVTGKVCKDSIESQQEEIWVQELNKSNNSAKSMYSGFKLKWRFMEVILIVYRASVLITFIIFSSIDLHIVSAILISLIHLGALIFSLKNQPYYSKAELYLLYATISSNLLNSIFLVGVTASTGEVSAVFSYLFIFPNVIVPAAAYAYGRCLEKKVEPVKCYADIAVDDKINSTVIRWILNFMAVLSIICVPTFYLFVLSIFFEPSATAGLHFDTRGQFDLATNEFGSYSTVQEFMDNCECMPNRSSKELGTEVWICKNNADFKYKLLNRRHIVDYGGMFTVFGYGLRDFCSKDFKFQYISNTWNFNISTEIANNDKGGRYAKLLYDTNRFSDISFNTSWQRYINQYNFEDVQKGYIRFSEYENCW